MKTPILTEINPGKYEARRLPDEPPFALLVAPRAHNLKTNKWAIHYRRFHPPHFDKSSSNSHHRNLTNAEYELTRTMNHCTDYQLGLAGKPQTTNAYPALAIEIADHDEHPDILHLCLPAEDGSSTGIRVASIEPDRYQTAGGDYQTSPEWDIARCLAAAPTMLAALELAQTTLQRLRPSHAHGPFSSIDGTIETVAAAITRATTPTE